MNRSDIASCICKKLEADSENLSLYFNSSGLISPFYIDDLLPSDLAFRIRNSFPDPTRMNFLDSLRERIYIAAQMNNYDLLLEEVIFAFQDLRVVELISKITSLPGLELDDKLYAGGISMMGKGHFLNPHIDNSHDKISTMLSRS